MDYVFVSRGDIVPEEFDVGPDSELRLVDVVDRTQGAPFCAGFCEVLPGAPVEFEYFDHHAVCYMLEGQITLTQGGESRAFLPGDVVYIPMRDDQRVSYSTTTYGKLFYVTYPYWR